MRLVWPSFDTATETLQTCWKWDVCAEDGWHQFLAHVYCGQTAGCIKMPLTWYGGRPRPRPQCVRWGPSSPRWAQQPPTFRPVYTVAKRSPSQQLLSCCSALLQWLKWQLTVHRAIPMIRISVGSVASDMSGIVRGQHTYTYRHTCAQTPLHRFVVDLLHML